MRIIVALTLVLWLALPSGSVQAVMSSIENLEIGQRQQGEESLEAAIALIRDRKPEQAAKLARQFLKTHPTSAAGYEVLGAALLAQHQRARAEAALAKALELEPARTSSMVLLGQLTLDEAEDPKGAEAWFAKAIQLAPRVPAARRSHAVSLLRLGRLQEAASEAQESLKLPGGGADIQTKYVLAGIYHEMGRHADAERLLREVLKAQPEFQEAILLQGLVELDLGQVDQASYLLQKAMGRDQKSIWARLGLGVIERIEGHPAQARADLEKLTAEQPKWSLAWFELGEARLAEGKIKDALEAFASAARVTPQPAVAKLRAAEALLKYGEAELASEQARAALASPEVSTQATLVLVAAALASGHADLAEQHLQQAIAAHPSDPAWTFQLGRFYLAQHRPQEALTQFKKTEALAPNEIEPIAGQAQASAAMGNAVEAIAAAKRATATKEETVEALLFLGQVYERLNQSDDAERAYQEARAKDPERATVMLALASLYAKTSHAGEAMLWLERTRKAAPPDDADALLGIAVVYQQLARPDLAIEVYQDILQRHRYHLLALNNLAFLLSQQPNRLEEASRLAETAYRLTPGDAQVADTLGWIECLRGHVDRAHTLLTKSVSATPDDPQHHYHLGLVYLKAHNLAQARAELTRAMALGAFAESEDAKRVLGTLP